MAEKTPQIIEIYTCPDKGLPMEAQNAVQAVAGVGLEGDRYALGKGAFSSPKNKVARHLTLISQEAIQLASQELVDPFSPAETRRNLVTKNVELNELLGVTFSIGSISVRGIELCDPCGRPSKLASKAGFKQAFENRGGLNAEILTSGVIEIGDSIHIG